MELRAVRNVVRTFNRVLDAFEKKDKTGTVSFILKWFGLLLRHTLVLLPLLHMNITFLIWYCMKRFSKYDENNPTKCQTAIRSISYAFIPITAVSLCLIFSVALDIFESFENEVLLYMTWFAWAVTIPILWFIDLFTKIDFNKDSLKFFGVKNVKITLDNILHKQSEGKEYTFLWVTSLISIAPGVLIGYFSQYIYDEFINIGNSRSLSCVKVNHLTDDTTVDTWNLCLDIYKYYHNDSSAIIDESSENTDVCCKLGGLSTESFLDVIKYLIVLVLFSRIFVQFWANFVIRSEQIRNPKAFKEALKEQIARVTTSVNNTIFSDNPISSDGINGGIKSIDKDDDDIDSDIDDDWQINKTHSNLDKLEHDIEKIVRKCERKKEKQNAVYGYHNGDANDSGNDNYNANDNATATAAAASSSQNNGAQLKEMISVQSEDEDR